MTTEVSARCQYSLLVVTVRVTLQLWSPIAAPKAVKAAINTDTTIFKIFCLFIIGPFFKIRCKDTSKLNNVFLFRWKFLQKIVFFSSISLLIVPSEAIFHPNYGNAVLFCYKC